MVANLILQDMREWNGTKVKYVFSPHLIRAILRIPLLPDNQPNTLVWAQEKNGLFKVSSAY